MVGSLVLARPSRWSPAALAFVRSAAQLLGASLESARAIRQSRQQGELLAQRNVELETLRELTARLR
jgi:GAF domain-containing protein